MRIFVQHPAINNGTETKLDVDMTPIHELPPTRGGLRDLADIQITVPLGSPEQKLLDSAVRDMQSPIRLRTDAHDGTWLITDEQWPGIPSDGLVRLTLSTTGDWTTPARIS